MIEIIKNRIAELKKALDENNATEQDLLQQQRQINQQLEQVRSNIFAARVAVSELEALRENDNTKAQPAQDVENVQAKVITPAPNQ